MEKILNGISIDKIDPLDSNVKEGYTAFKQEVTRKAIASLRERIPKKILYFNTFVETSGNPGNIFNCNDLEKETYRNCKRGKGIKREIDEISPGASFPSHRQIYKELEVIKQEASELIEIVGNVKLWIQLNVPRIEDGNNFGVGIQEEVIQELTRVEDTAFNLYDAIVKYYMARAKLSTKVIKYPGVSDYEEAIRELDEKEWIHIKITKVDMRNNYSMLYDLLCKNWEKIVKPKSEDGHYRMTF